MLNTFSILLHHQAYGRVHASTHPPLVFSGQKRCPAGAPAPPFFGCTPGSLYLSRGLPICSIWTCDSVLRHVLVVVPAALIVHDHEARRRAASARNDVPTRLPRPNLCLVYCPPSRALVYQQMSCIDAAFDMKLDLEVRTRRSVGVVHMLPCNQEQIRHILDQVRRP